MRPLALAAALWSAAAGPAALPELGEFQSHGNVGEVRQAGSVRFDPQSGEYRITGGGENMWGGRDAFHFVWRRLPGDLTLTADVSFPEREGVAHRKAGWIVREGLEADSPYADAVVHADGLISLQYRLVKGGPTLEVQSPVKAPATIRLERTGDLFTLSVSRDGRRFQPVGSVTVALADPVYAGLGVCAHDAASTATAVLSRVSLESRGTVAAAERVLESRLEVVSIESGERTVVHTTRDHIEAPNWSRDGRELLFNSHGRLYSLPRDGGEPRRIDTGGADHLNNDHGLSPDGRWLAISHSPQSDSLVYVLPATGGPPRQVTALGPSYWHGWSPDGKTLAYCARRNGEFDVYTIAADAERSTAEKRLTTAPGLDDGPDYSPDGQAIFFNSERTGLMRVWRMRPDGSEQQPVTSGEDSADWFPHPSPDGKWLVFLSYDKSVSGHPANKDVALKVMPLSGGAPRILARLFGGQGTINVPSWSPDSRSLAFVSYRLVKP
ncbi:MAG: biopolymer transporter TolR [Acidobacteria bacterium]|nr:MAG: biopolymer transporter TolR [Acidobacteriota bacterium]